MEEDPCLRARRYIEGLKSTLGRALNEGIATKFPRLFDAAKRYTNDSEYFLNKGDCTSALVAASYAEGLLDALGYLNLAKVEWRPKYEKQQRVMVAGTFDLLHPGHIELLRYASGLGRLYVVVSRDVNAERVKKRPLILDEESRLRLVSSIKYVYSARLGSRSDILEPLKDIRPDVIVLGPDQPYDEAELADTIQSRLGFRPRVVRFKEKTSFAKGMSSTTDIIRKICDNLCGYVK